MSVATTRAVERGVTRLVCASTGNTAASSAAYAARAIGMGFRLVTLMNDSGLMATYARMSVAQTRKESGGKA